MRCSGKLRAFGIQAWRLDGDEIIKLARRHRRTLKGLRLRDVLLKEGSKWRDVLAMLRVEMEMLDWVSLRRAGYAAHFDQYVAGTVELHNDEHHGGGEIPPSDSDDEWEENAEADHQHHVDQDEDENEEIDGSSGSEIDDDDDYDNGDDDDDDESVVNSEASDNGPEANDLRLDSPASVPYCTCGRVGWSDDPDDLGDNGVNVSYSQRKMWEQWVIKRCLEHSQSF